jgi:glutathione S-transferase
VLTRIEALARPTIVGRSSSHFTRVARIFAAELGVECAFQVVSSLLSNDSTDYGGNPALKLPTLQTPEGSSWFGALQACRELARRSPLAPRIVWPEHLDIPLLANAQELVLGAMATEVTIIMAQLESPSAHGAHQTKLHQSLRGTLAWLEDNVRPVLEALPGERDLSYLEVTLFCLMTHLPFREVLPLAGYPELSDFCRHFAARPSAMATEYRFDV